MFVRNSLSSLFLAALPLVAFTACDLEEDSGDAEFERSGSLSAEYVPPVADYFIVTRVDYRKCVAPLCGGWFVKRVNSDVTQCADGTWQAECHMFELDLSGLGLNPNTEEKFSEVFGNGGALVRGSLEEVDIGSYFPADTLVATEAWAGVTGQDPDGHFSRVDATGIQCVTFPCPYFFERALNTVVSDDLASVDLAASGANASQVEKGMAELNDSGLLIAGDHEIVSGPAGEMNGLLANEFYTRID